MTLVYKVTITEQSGNDLTDYTVKLTIDNTLQYFWKYANTNNIYFIDENGNPLYFYIEQFDTTNQNATIWVKIPSIPASKSVTIYMYVDNNNPYQNYNDPTKAFYIYDDFNESSLSSIWNVVSGTPSISNGYLVLPSGGTTISTSSSLLHLYVKVKCYIDTLPSSADGGLDVVFARDTNGDMYDAWLDYKSGVTQNNADLRYCPSGSACTWFNGNWTPDTNEHVWEIYRDQSGSMKLLLDGSQVASGSSTAMSSSAEFRLVGFGTDTFNMYVDYVLVRNYVDPEPSTSISFYQAYGSASISVLTYDTRTITVTTYKTTTATRRSNTAKLIGLGILFILGGYIIYEAYKEHERRYT